MNELFSRKHNLNRPSIGLIHDSIPQGVRQALLNFLHKNVHINAHSRWMDIQRVIFEAPKVKSDFEFDFVEMYAHLTVEKVVRECQWYSFLDICELLAALFDDKEWKRYYPRLDKSVLETEINGIFTDSALGYELKSGRIEKLGAPQIDRVVNEVRQLLQNPEYSGPNDQFEKALRFLNQRPNPDPANCVKDAVGATEGLARVVSGNNKLTLSKILDSEPFRSEIHGALREMMQKLYAYRGDAEGAGHGQTSTGQISVEEAELALGVSASCMIYLAKRFGKEP
jgi:hypothetical protein